MDMGSVAKYKTMEERKVDFDGCQHQFRWQVGTSLATFPAFCILPCRWLREEIWSAKKGDRHLLRYVDTLGNISKFVLVVVINFC